MTTTTYKAPENPHGVDVTPSFVRDEIIACFESANREFLRLLNLPIDNEILKSQVRKFVTTVFANCGSSYWDPTKESILEASNHSMQGNCRGNDGYRRKGSHKTPL
jgi:hypothetical protein